MAELTTAVRYRLGIVHVLRSNDELGKTSKEQRGGGRPVWQTALRNPDFAAFARSGGGLGRRVETAGELAGALREAPDGEGPALVEVVTDKELI